MMAVKGDYDGLEFSQLSSFSFCLLVLPCCFGIA